MHKQGLGYLFLFFFSSRRRHTILTCDWSSDVCSSDLDHLGLLVEVTIEEHRVRGTGSPRYVDEQARRAALEPHDLELHAGQRVLAAPLRRELRRLLDVAVPLPVAIEVRRLGRYADVFGERGDDRVVPQRGDRAHFSGGT